MARGNQYKPNPPMNDQLVAGIHKFYRQGFHDKKILESLLEGNYYDSKKYGLGLRRFRGMREKLGLIRSRKAGLGVDDIRPAMSVLREIYPRAGMRDMKRLLMEEHNLAVTRSVLSEYFLLYEPHLIRARRSQRFRRKRFWAAGVMDMLCCDQHDKWKRFGLRLHTAIDPFIGKIHWIKIWYTNSHPVLIASYFLDDAEESGSIPLITQSDPGSENFGIAKAQTFLRHWHDPTMEGHLCHRWMKEKKNIPPEISWSQLRRRFTPGFENILDKGVHMGWYNIDDTVHRLTFRWTFIPWLQFELDAYRSRVNSSAKRRNRNKILPHGVPDHMAEFPHLYGALDFKVQIEREAITEARALYAPPSHDVFNLVPTSFETTITRGYTSLGSPAIDRNNVWAIYCDLVKYIYADMEAKDIRTSWEDELEAAEAAEAAQTMLPEPEVGDLLPLIDTGDRPDGSFYLGGVNRGAGLGAEHHAQLDEMVDADEPRVEMEDLWVEGPQPICVMFSEDEDDFDDFE
ncbi:hypothetical protein AB1N83_012342 [Pleurotus pulmonarius]|nr:hypothetical protein EYR36_010144 [Pleurotus pulmonarius]